MKDLIIKPDGWTAEQYLRLFLAVSEAVTDVGAVNYVLYAGGRVDHPYHFLAMLGEKKVNESTYYDNEKKLQKLDAMGLRYDVFGAYVATTKERPQQPEYPFWTLDELLTSRRDVWECRAKELMLYCGTDPAAVAEALRQ